MTCHACLIFLLNYFFCLDVAGSKSSRPSGGYSRGGKRREPQNSSLSATNPRRPPPKGARGGGWKQPPSRGYPPQYGGSAVAEEDEIEVGSLFNYGSKKQVRQYVLHFLVFIVDQKKVLHFSPQNFNISISSFSRTNVYNIHL